MAAGSLLALLDDIASVLDDVARKREQYNKLRDVAELAQAVRELSPDGAPLAPAWIAQFRAAVAPHGYTVTAVGTNTVTVSGSAAPLVGDVLVFDDYANTTTTQRTRYAQWANDRNEVAAGVPPFRFGES